MHDITKYKLILISGEIHKLRPCNFTSPQIFPGLHLIGLGIYLGGIFRREAKSDHEIYPIINFRNIIPKCSLFY